MSVLAYVFSCFLKFRVSVPTHTHTHTHTHTEYSPLGWEQLDRGFSKRSDKEWLGSPRLLSLPLLSYGGGLGCAARHEMDVAGASLARGMPGARVLLTKIGEEVCQLVRKSVCMSRPR